MEDATPFADPTAAKQEDAAEAAEEEEKAAMPGDFQTCLIRLAR